MLLYTSVVSLEEPETGLGGGSEGPAHIIERYCGNGGSGHLGKLSVNRCAAPNYTDYEANYTTSFP